MIQELVPLDAPRVVQALVPLEAPKTVQELVLLEVPEVVPLEVAPKRSVVGLRRGSEVELAWERCADEWLWEEEEAEVRAEMNYPAELYERVVSLLKGASA